MLHFELIFNLLKSNQENKYQKDEDENTDSPFLEKTSEERGYTVLKTDNKQMEMSFYSAKNKSVVDSHTFFLNKNDKAVIPIFVWFLIGFLILSAFVFLGVTIHFRIKNKEKKDSSGGNELNETESEEINNNGEKLI